MVATTANKHTPQADLDPTSLRSLNDRRVRTAKAAHEALLVVRWVTTGKGPQPDETRLFAALQSCAYRAAHKSRDRHLSVAERTTWAERWKLIRDHLVEDNLGLVYTMISRFDAKGVDWEDKRSDALFALIRAIDGFNPWRGFRFSTYACNAITRSLIHLSRKTSEHRARFPLEHEVWLEQPTRADGWAELFADRLHRALAGNLGELTDREAAVLGWRFPLNGGRGMTLGEIGEAIGLSKERARQIQEIALAKLRLVLEADPALH